ncbi:helix-turn-helix domain-containing protein [Lentzea guizhouensis]|uniref:helix-turn-helix domain-containing protein n=1 Tax=Lentzea guizhouensis TaxID=1586287 RepID=UPI001F1C8E91|nr:helix-turn-helix domain-containing protein [Lentzea guizhouensis]
MVCVDLTLDGDEVVVEREETSMAEPVRARRLTENEGRTLLRITRRGKHESIRVRRATIIMAAASGTPAPAIARLLGAHEDTVRDVIHAFNERGPGRVGPSVGGRPSPPDQRR